MKGSGSIRCPFTLARRPGGRGRRWAPVGRQPKRQPRRGGPRPYPLTIRPQPRRPLRETRARPSRLHPDSSTSRRGVPRKGRPRTNRSRARPKNPRRRTYLPIESEVAWLNNAGRPSFQLFVIRLVCSDHSTDRSRKKEFFTKSLVLASLSSSACRNGRPYSTSAPWNRFAVSSVSCPPAPERQDGSV